MCKKFEAFGWSVSEVDGHDQKQLTDIFTKEFDNPHFVLANTIKGKGCSMMEGNPEWHHKFPSLEEYDLLMGELK